MHSHFFAVSFHIYSHLVVKDAPPPNVSQARAPTPFATSRAEATLKSTLYIMLSVTTVHLAPPVVNVSRMKLKSLHYIAVLCFQIHL